MTTPPEIPASPLYRPTPAQALRLARWDRVRQQTRDTYGWGRTAAMVYEHRRTTT
jgi:hypothetical protein